MAVWLVPKLGTELLEFMGPVLYSLGLEMVPLCDNCVLNYGLGVIGSEMTMDSRFHFVEPMLGERATHRKPTAHLGTVKNSPGLFD